MVSHTEYRRRLVTFVRSLKPSLSRESCRQSSYLDKALRQWFLNFFERDPNLSFIIISRPKSKTNVEKVFF